MAVPETLVEYWKSEVDRIEVKGAAPAPDTGELPDAKAALAAATAAEATANAQVTASAKAVTDARKTLDDARSKLATIPMPADSDPLVAAMRDALVAWREALVANVADEADRIARRAERERWADRVAALTQELATANAALERQNEIAKKTAQWSSDAGQAPLKDAKVDADTLLGSADRTNAEAKVKSYFPSNAAAAKNFLVRARTRRALAAARSAAAYLRATDALARSTAWLQSTTREAAKTAALAREYDKAVEELVGLTQAPQRIAAAKSALIQVANRTVAPVSNAQGAELTDPTRKAPREAALELLGKRDDAQSDVIQAELDYQTALYAARVSAPDKTEAELLAADAALKAKLDQLDPTVNGTKAKKLLDAKNALDAAKTDLLESWFAAVPDTLWDELDRLDGAVAQLQDVSDHAPANIVAKFKDAEKALAKNLDDIRNERRQEDLILATLKQRVAQASGEQDLDPRRRQAATRFVDEI